MLALLIRIVPVFNLSGYTNFQVFLKNLDTRKEWTRLMKRTTKRKSAWTPGESDMVCSKHFIDGMPTSKNPHPALKLGYELPAKKARRTLVFSKPSSRNEASKNDEEHDDSINGESNTNEDSSDLHEKTVLECEKCQQKNDLIGTLTNAVKSLSIERDQLKSSVTELSQKHTHHIAQAKKKAKVFSWTSIKLDAKMKFYTGVQSIKCFNVLFSLIEPCLPKVVYWRGKKNISTKYKRTATKRAQKVSGKNQFLLVLVRLRLGLLNEDLADSLGLLKVHAQVFLQLG